LVTANALHPGVVRTSFGAEDPAGVQRLLVPFPDLEQVTGRYFVNSKPKRSSERSYDQAAAARLWQVSAALVGLTV
jgi:retinol dehydrogenase 14